MPWYNRPISADHVLLIGFGMCAIGTLSTFGPQLSLAHPTHSSNFFWLVLGGIMLFMLGVQAMKKEAGGLQGEGGESENPLGRPPS